MINSVERGTEVEKAEQFHTTSVSCDVCVRQHLQHGGLCGVVTPVKHTDAVISDRVAGDERSAGHTYSVPTSSR